jgi:hypothetical protein
VAGAADAQVYIEAVLKDSVTGALNDLEQDAKRVSENSEAHITNRFGGAMKLLGGLAVSAGAALVTMIGQGVAGAMEAEAAAAQLDAVIKSTGNAAGVSKEALKAYADQMQLNTKFTAEQVTATQSMLLTFTNIGASGGIFDQATQAAIDMAAALGGEAKDKALLLGKALNDPVQGVSALTRVGVTFSESQKEVIKKLAETGNVAGAQKLILAELSKEFGGSATAAGKTMAGQLAIAKNAFGEVTEEIGVKLLPVLTKILQWVVANMPAIQSGIGKAMDFVSKVFQAVKKDVDTVVAAFNLIVDAVKTVAAGINAGTKAVKTATENLWATIKGVFINVTKFFTDIGKAIIDGIVAGIKAAPKAVADALGGVVNGAVQGVKDLLGIKSPSRVFAEIGSFIVQGLTVGLEGEAPAFLTAVNNLANAAITAIARIRDGNVLSGIQGLVSGIASIFQAGTSPVLKAVGGFLGAISAAIQGWIVAGPLGALLGFIGAAVSWVVSLFGGKPTAAPAAPEIPPAPEVTIPEIEPPKWEPPQQSGMSMPGISIQSAVATPIVEGARIIRDAGASFQGSVNAFGTTVARADAMYLRVEAMFARLEQAAANGTAGLRYA